MSSGRWDETESGRWRLLRLIVTEGPRTAVGSVEIADSVR